MRILTVGGDLVGLGGLDRCQLDICRGLHARGHDVHLVYRSAGDLHPQWTQFATSSAVPWWTPSEGPMSAPVRLSRAAWSTRRCRPDVVYAHHYSHLALATVLARRTPMALHLHTAAPASFGRLGRRLCARVDRYIAVSHATGSDWIRAGIAPSKVGVVLNGVDTHRLRPFTPLEQRAVRQALEIPDTSVSVFYAGRLNPRKGIEVLLTAFNLLLARGVDATLVVAGEAGFDLGESAGLAYVSDLRRRVPAAHCRWLGHRDDLGELLAAADVVVVPSLWPDPNPLVVAEALASGCPVVASRVGGIPEQMQGELSELLVPAGDAEGIADAVSRLRDGRALSRLREAARAVAVARLDIGRCVDDVERVLASMVP